MGWSARARIFRSMWFARARRRGPMRPAVRAVQVMASKVHSERRPSGFRAGWIGATSASPASAPEWSRTPLAVFSLVVDIC